MEQEKEGFCLKVLLKKKGSGKRKKERGTPLRLELKGLRGECAAHEGCVERTILSPNSPFDSPIFSQQDEEGVRGKEKKEEDEDVGEGEDGVKDVLHGRKRSKDEEKKRREKKKMRGRERKKQEEEEE